MLEIGNDRQRCSVATQKLLIMASTDNTSHSAMIDIGQVAASIMERKERERKSPVCATLMEILAELPPLVTDAMRCLHDSGKYRGSMNYNKLPMLLKEK